VRRAAALIVGGGPAGSAAAIRLAKGGVRPLLIERSEGPRDVVCGGFLGWDALAALRRLGIDPQALGAQPISRLRLISRHRQVETALPHPAAGLSRRTLDEALLSTVQAAGVEVLRGRTVRAAEGSMLRLDDGEEMQGEALLLATGKHELRGLERDADIASASVGLRTSLSGPNLKRSLAGVIELHLFDGGYGGLLVQDDGSVNLCLSVSRSRLKAAGGVEQLVGELRWELPSLRERLEQGEAGEWSAVAGVPYGWRAKATAPGVYRVGDQAAVIASLAGDGIAIALESGMAAAEALLSGASAPTYQSAFARQSAVPVRLAEALRKSAERPLPRAMLMGLVRAVPGAARLAARLTRVG
jgi:flavin-dependent dehydrogenase